MVSYAEFADGESARRKSMQDGLHGFLGIPEDVKVYLDNGSFSFRESEHVPDAREYREFVNAARPDWKPVRFDAIPMPRMSKTERQACFSMTMQMNRRYRHDGFVPVLHAGPSMSQFLEAFLDDERLASKHSIAIGGLVPYLLRRKRARDCTAAITGLAQVRSAFPQATIHAFGLGAPSTIHLANLLGFDSVDSSAWRNRARFGIVHVKETGERRVVGTSRYADREPDEAEWKCLQGCCCPACRLAGVEGLLKQGTAGFCNRATHNAWVLHEEQSWIDQQLLKGTYGRSVLWRLRNSRYLRAVEAVLAVVGTEHARGVRQAESGR
jgi:hypothetical protein